MTDGFSWENAQKKRLLRIPKRIAQMEKQGNGDNVMMLKLQLKKLKRRIELDKTSMAEQDKRAEVDKVA